ncbi:hypothetical protein FLX27_11340 [Agrobacterium tumefaciens]|uniref:hypothetical protein n=1 Tax=Agrobacterium pusense TaxID=648995 RepID=UPI00114D8646|nr:hypothetical protein [Agrobacterium tumefaciens]TQN61444.1 hypothetical protein FLX27_11340 [Agrobacterium tumefaciens]
MPRPKNPINERNRLRTERWRERRRIAGRPEASMIDRAVAASVAAFLTADLHGEEPYRFTLRDIVMGAQKLLVDQGFDKREANTELMRRMTRRSDLAKVSEVTGAGHKPQ